MEPVLPPRALARMDDRDSFDCGRDSLNNWFRRHAWTNHVEGLSRVNVLVGAETRAIAGYVTLSSASIEREFLAKPERRNRPDPIPVTLLGQLAVDRSHQGRGHGRSLLLFALRASLRARVDVASFGVVTHPIDKAAREFYGRWGFREIPFDPRRAMMVRMMDLETSLGG